MSLTPEQVEKRKKGIGSSDIPAILGLVPWSGPIDVWLTKTGRSEPFSSTQTNIGNRLEEPIADMVADSRDIEIERWQETIQHCDHEIALATPDFAIVDGTLMMGLLEVKNVGHRVLSHWETDCPDYVAAQVQWQLEITGLDLGIVGALLGGRDMRIVDLERDQELGADMLQIAEDFWRDHVVADVAPPIDGSNSAREYLKKRFAKHGGEIVKAPAEATDWAAQYLAATRDEKDARARKALAHNQLAVLVADTGGIFGPWGRAVWIETKAQDYMVNKKPNRYIKVTPSKEAKNV